MLLKFQTLVVTTLLALHQTWAVSIPTNLGDLQEVQEEQPIKAQEDDVKNSTSACFEPKAVGPCRASVLSFYYNQATGKCEPFNWGGCNPNGNNFESIQECTKKCTDQIYQEGGGKPIVDPEVRKSVCELEPHRGNCLGNRRVWAYDSKLGACRPFSFTGCGGNANHFQSEAECLSFCGTGVDLLRNLDPSEDQKTCRDVKCPGGVRHYQELGCQPVYDSGACCPTRFSCPDTPSKNSSQCAYKGKIYNLGDSVPAAESGQSCRASCACTYDGVSCASVECPDLFGYYPKPNCTIGLYKAGDCCAYDYACGNETTTCDYEGQSYYEGQRIYPKDESCLVCYCRAGFNGTLTSEFCEEVDCGIQVWYAKELERGCSPIYFNHTDDKSSRLSCCPIMWHCPDELEETGHGTSQVSVPQPPQEERIMDQNMTDTESSSASPAPSTESTPLDVSSSPLPELTSAAPASSNDSDSAGATQQQSIPPEVPETVAQKTETTVSPPAGPSPCELPAEKGNCKAYRVHYHYNTTSGKCEEFVYTGCGGNDNNFVTLSDCKATCVKETGLQTRFSFFVKREEKKVDPCTLPLSQGRCRAFFPRYFFNPELNKCQLFIFGGCGRNENNFFTLQACSSTCLSVYPNVCDQPPRDLVQRCLSEPVVKYYYDTDAGTCLPFNSTGCSTSNVFTSTEDCRRTCAPESKAPQKFSPFGILPVTSPVQRASTSKVCSLPKRTGPCYASFESYYFDTASGTCQQFLYGGCMGNGNRFNSMEACTQTCGSGMVPFSFSGPSKSLSQVQILLPVGPLDPVEQKPGNNTSNATGVTSMIFARMGPGSPTILVDNSTTIDSEDSFFRPQVEDPSLMEPPSNFNLPQVEDPSLMQPEESTFNSPQVEDPSLMHSPSSFDLPQVEDPSLMQPEPNFNSPQVEDPSLMQPPSNFNLPQVVLEDPPQLMQKPQISPPRRPQVMDPSVMGPSSSFNRPQVEDPSLMVKPDDSKPEFPTIEAKPTYLKPDAVGGAIEIMLPVQSSQDNTLHFNERCTRPLDAGTCDQQFLRFHWDGNTCRPFNYTGCGGNKNNFRSEYECRTECDNEYIELQSNSDCVFGNRVITYGSSLTEFKCGKEYCACVVPPSVTCTLRPCSTVVPDK